MVTVLVCSVLFLVLTEGFFFSGYNLELEITYNIICVL